MSDTIQTDVPAAAPAAPKQPQQTAREIAMEALETRHQNNVMIDNGYEPLGEIKAGPALTMADDPTPPADPVIDQLAAQLAEAPPAATPAPATHKVKIDGEESMVSADEIRNYQVGKSADKRLAEATRLLREAQDAAAVRHHQEQQEAQLRAQQQAAPVPPPESAANTVASGKEFLKALFEGDEENALTALEKVMSSRLPQAAPAAPAPAIDINQLTNAVTQQVQQKLTTESALERNRVDYPELYANPMMEKLALIQIAEKREADGSDFLSALDAVSRDMAATFKWGAAAAPSRPADPVPTTPRAAKLEAKKQIDNVSSINTKTTSDQVPEESASDIIAAMRAARGG